MQLLKQSTAYTFRIGPFVDSTDGVTAETGLTISQADIQISKAGGAFAQTSAAPTTTHDTDGWYQCPLTTTDTATLGTLDVQVTEAGALPVWKHFMVVTANVFDTLCSTDQLDVNVTNVAGTSQTGNDNGADINAILVDTSTTLQAELDAIQAAVITNAAGADIAADIIAIKAETATIVADTNELQTDDIPGTLATIDGKVDTIDGNVDSILTDTGTTLQAELDAIQAAVITNAAGVDIAADIIAVKAETATIVADTNELQGDWTNTGRLDTILDSILNDTDLIDDGTSGLAKIATDVAAVLVDTNELQTDNIPGTLSTIDGKVDTIDTNVDSILADTGTDGVVVAAASKTGYTLTAGGIDAIFADTGTIALAYGVLLERIYEMISDKMTVNEATGAVALRNIGDSADLATGSVTSSSGTTTRAELSWV